MDLADGTGDSMDGTPGHLQLSPEAMRALGGAVIDEIVAHFAELPGKTVTNLAGRAALDALLQEPPPEHGADPLAVLQTVRDAVTGYIMHPDHPRFFAFVPGPSNFVGAMGDALAAGYNVFAGTWFESSGPARIEMLTIDWLRQLCGMPIGGGGLFVSGGSLANLTALAVARERLSENDWPRAVLYCSDQTHSSVDRAARTLGIVGDRFRRLASDGGGRLDPCELHLAIQSDRAAGLLPLAVIANAGTTNTGAVDPLPEIADLCAADGLWFHVDGAYAAAAIISPRAAPLLSGLDRADSLVLDPHKWLFQPYDIGCLLVRDASQLESAFAILPEYLRDIGATTGEINYCDNGLELTRRFRALKLWMSFKVFGLAAFRAAIERGIQVAETAGYLLREAGCWEITSPAQLAVISFRHRNTPADAGAAEDFHRRLLDALVADGHSLVTGTALNGRSVLRLCTVNPRTTDADLRETLTRLRQLAESV